MNKKTIFIFSLLYFINLVTLNYGQMSFWHINNPYALKLIALENVVESNNALMNLNGETGFFITEDILVNNPKIINQIFIRFTKKFFSSYVQITLFDSYTGEKIQSCQFYENKVIDFHNASVIRNRIYIKVELFGSDIEIRSVGVILQNQEIANPNGFQVFPQILNADQNNLSISLILEQEARLILYIYDHKGTIVRKIVDGQILSSGKYLYQWDPLTVPLNQSAQYYYIWAKLENLRSDPVEFSKSIYIIPN